MNVIHLPNNHEYLILSYHIESKKRKRLFIITYLTEKEYHQLDKFITEGVNVGINIIRENQKFTIKAYNIEAYGDIDFSPNSADLKELELFDWFDNLEPGYVIPANYDYNTHTCKSPTKKYKRFDSINPALIMPYIHGLLNKPKYTVIFREYSNKK